MSDAVVRSISLFPIKSLDGVAVGSARVLPSGALQHDREFALFDEKGNVINGKRAPGIHLIRATFDLEESVVTLNGSDSFHLIDDRDRIEHWFSSALDRRVILRRNTLTGFPDDLEASGPTVIGSASLQLVADWFAITEPDETKRRFRANIELETDQPFWEDRLFGEPETTLEFQIGNVTVLGVNPCARCSVPSRNPWTGEASPEFQRVFSENREEMLPTWADASRFDHYYRLAVNTRIPASEVGKAIRVGDAVKETGRNC